VINLFCLFLVVGDGRVLIYLTVHSKFYPLVITTVVANPGKRTVNRVKNIQNTLHSQKKLLIKDILLVSRSLSLHTFYCLSTFKLTFNPPLKFSIQKCINAFLLYTSFHQHLLKNRDFKVCIPSNTYYITLKM